MTPHPRPLLTIDARHYPPLFGASDGVRTGTLRMLSADDIVACARWLASIGGRPLLDAFELRLLQQNCISGVQLQDEDGTPIEAEVEVVGIERYDSGLYLRWQSKFPCDTCKGLGWLLDEDLERLKLDVDEGRCGECGGEGHWYGSDLLTDYDGRAVPGQGRSFADEQRFMSLGWR